MTKDDENENIDETIDEPIGLPESYLGLSHHNNTHYFLCPLFGVNKVLKYKEYLNSYIDDAGRKSVIDCPLYCLFKFNNMDDSEAITNYFSLLPNYVFSYYAGKSNGEDLVMYALRANEEDKKDYKHIINGRYSHTSEAYKQKYKDFGFIKSTLTFVDAIVNKSPKFKKDMESYLGEEIDEKSELWNIFEPKREVFRYGT